MTQGNAFPLASFNEAQVDAVNELLITWAHDLGPCRRPFRQEGWILEVDGQPVAAAISASIVSAHLSDDAGTRLFGRGEVVELARLCAAPGSSWALRVMLRLWRQVAAPRWASWPVRAAASYSKNARHGGQLYRFDGWRKVREDCGSSGGGAWSKQRGAADAVTGSKTLWLWEYV